MRRILWNTRAALNWGGFSFAVKYFLYCLNCACNRHSEDVKVFINELHAFGMED